MSNLARIGLATVLMAAVALGAQATGTPVRTAPRVVERVAPVFPREALRKGIEGVVVARLQVDAQGSVTAVAIRTSPHELLSDAAEAAFRKWKYHPASLDGQAIASTVRVEVDFRLQEEPVKIREHGTQPPDASVVSRYVAARDGVESFRFEYWREDGHKAFASAADGSWGWASKRSTPAHAAEGARQNCDAKRKQMTRPCRIVDIDGQWQASAERTATPLRMLTLFEIRSHPREKVESWDEARRSRAIPFLDQCRAEADRYVQLWKAQELDAMYQGASQDFRDQFSRPEFERLVAQMNQVFGALRQATFSQQALVTRWGDDELLFDLHSEVVYAATTAAGPGGTMLAFTLSPEAGACRMAGMYYAAPGMPAPWMPRESGQDPQRGT